MRNQTLSVQKTKVNTQEPKDGCKILLLSAVGVTNVTAAVNDIFHWLMHVFDFEMDDFDLGVLKVKLLTL